MFGISMYPRQEHIPFLRYDQIKEELHRLGYVVSAAMCNTANYGLPQQRTRAWVMCVLASQCESSAGDLMREALLSFQCQPVPLEIILSKAPPVEEGKSASKPVRPLPMKSAAPKWKDSLKHVFKQFGKARTTHSQ